MTSGYLDGLDAYELGREPRFAILEKHGDDLAKVRVQLVEGLRLRMGTRKARNVRDVETGVGVTLYNCLVGPHVRHDLEFTPGSVKPNDRRSAAGASPPAAPQRRMAGE